MRSMVEGPPTEVVVFHRRPSTTTLRVAVPLPQRAGGGTWGSAFQLRPIDAEGHALAALGGVERQIRAAGEFLRRELLGA